MQSLACLYSFECIFYTESKKKKEYKKLISIFLKKKSLNCLPVAWVDSPQRED